MTNKSTNQSSGPTPARTGGQSEEIIRQLEQFPIEALEAALQILTDQSRLSRKSASSAV